MLYFTKSTAALVLVIVWLGFQPASANELPTFSCNIGQLADIKNIAWEDGGSSPWPAAEPENLADGNYGGWHIAPSPPRRVQITLNGVWNLKEIQFFDNWGNGNLLLSTANSSNLSVTTDYYPLGWHSQTIALPESDTVYLSVDSNNLKIDEIQFCGTASPTPVSPVTPVSPGIPGTPAVPTIPIAPIAPIAPITPNTPETPVQDYYPQSAHVIDSFGQLTVPDDSGKQWDAIREYYDEYYASSTHNRVAEGMCSLAIHNSYWVLSDEQGQPPHSNDYDSDGDYENYYPTWHPPVHAEGTDQECYFMHEHGEDPRPSAHYAANDELNIGVPFGFVHSKGGNHGGASNGHKRKEDHVGHKVIRQDKYILVNGQPYNDGTTFDEVGIQCDWLSKVHQGSHSGDALGNNLHEYFLNLSCTDGTRVRVKELVSWGYRNRAFTENCNRGWSWAGFQASEPDHDPGENGHPFNDGKREFGCVAARLFPYNAGPYAGNPKMLAELWKPDGSISAPDNKGTVIFSPYYITRNSIRYFDHQWPTRFDTTRKDTYLGFSCTSGDSDGDPSNNCSSNAQCMAENSGNRDGCTGTGGMVSSVDLCVRGSDAWEHTIGAIDAASPYVDYTNGSYPGFCNTLDSGIRNVWEQQIRNAPDGKDTLALSNARKNHQNNPFNGAVRAVHQKRIAVYQAGSTTPSYQGDKVFCTNAFGDAPVWPNFDTGKPVCPPLTILQSMSPTNNNWDAQNITGSNVGAFGWNGEQQFNDNDRDTGLKSGGEASEWTIEGVSDPSRKVRSPN